MDEVVEYDIGCFPELAVSGLLLLADDGRWSGCRRAWRSSSATPTTRPDPATRCTPAGSSARPCTRCWGRRGPRSRPGRTGSSSRTSICCRSASGTSYSRSTRARWRCCAVGWRCPCPRSRWRTKSAVCDPGWSQRPNQALQRTRPKRRAAELSR